MTFSSFGHAKTAPVIVIIKRYPIIYMILPSFMHIDCWSYTESLCRLWSTEWMHRVHPDSAGCSFLSQDVHRKPPVLLSRANKDLTIQYSTVLRKIYNHILNNMVVTSTSNVFIV